MIKAFSLFNPSDRFSDGDSQEPAAQQHNFSSWSSVRAVRVVWMVSHISGWSSISSSVVLSCPLLPRLTCPRLGYHTVSVLHRPSFSHSDGCTCCCRSLHLLPAKTVCLCVYVSACSCLQYPRLEVKPSPFFQLVFVPFVSSRPLCAALCHTTSLKLHLGLGCFVLLTPAFHHSVVAFLISFATLCNHSWLIHFAKSLLRSLRYVGGMVERIGGLGSSDVMCLG